MGLEIKKSEDSMKNNILGLMGLLVAMVIVVNMLLRF